jgi:hypothetical protein
LWGFALVCCFAFTFYYGKFQIYVKIDRRVSGALPYLPITQLQQLATHNQSYSPRSQESYQYGYKMGYNSQPWSELEEHPGEVARELTATGGLEGSLRLFSIPRNREWPGHFPFLWNIN